MRTNFDIESEIKIFDIKKKRKRSEEIDTEREMDGENNRNDVGVDCFNIIDRQRNRSTAEKTNKLNSSNRSGKRRRISLRAGIYKKQLKDFFNEKFGTNIKDEALECTSYEEFFEIIKARIFDKLGNNNNNSRGRVNILNENACFNTDTNENSNTISNTLTLFSNRNLLEVKNEITDLLIPSSTHNNSKICSICITPVEFDHRHYLKCGHLFHDECISKWLKMSTYCPNCKSQLYPPFYRILEENVRDTEEDYERDYSDSDDFQSVYSSSEEINNSEIVIIRNNRNHSDQNYIFTNHLHQRNSNNNNSHSDVNSNPYYYNQVLDEVFVAVFRSFALYTLVVFFLIVTVYLKNRN